MIRTRPTIENVQDLIEEFAILLNCQYDGSIETLTKTLNEVETKEKIHCNLYIKRSIAYLKKNELINSQADIVYAHRLFPNSLKVHIVFVLHSVFEGNFELANDQVIKLYHSDATQLIPELFYLVQKIRMYNDKK